MAPVILPGPTSWTQLQTAVGRISFRHLEGERKKKNKPWAIKQSKCNLTHPGWG